jgi:hypothetical protein
MRRAVAAIEREVRGMSEYWHANSRNRQTQYFATGPWRAQVFTNRHGWAWAIYGWDDFRPRTEGQSPNERDAKMRALAEIRSLFDDCGRLLSAAEKEAARE